MDADGNVDWEVARSKLPPDVSQDSFDRVFDRCKDIGKYDARIRRAMFSLPAISFRSLRASARCLCPRMPARIKNWRRGECGDAVRMQSNVSAGDGCKKAANLLKCAMESSPSDKLFSSADAQDG